MNIKPSKQTGFGLIDLMVGLTVGVLVTFALYGSIAFYDAAKRSAVSGNSALANAMTSIHLMRNDVELAGLGLTLNDTFACSTFNAYFNGVRSNGNVVAPAAIQEVANQPNQITVMHANAIISGAPASLLVSMIDASSPLLVNSTFSSQISNLAFIALPETNTPCTLVQVTQATVNGSTVSLAHDAGVSRYNPPNPDLAYHQSVAYPADAVVLNIDSLSWLTWRINNNVLEVVDNLTGDIQAIADNIVQLQAQYGVTNPGSISISQWVSANGEWANLDSAHVKRIRAIRIAIVARNVERDRPDNNGNCNATTQAPISWPGSPPLSLTADPNWQCYRYRVLRTVIPLKNVIVGVKV